MCCFKSSSSLFIAVCLKKNNHTRIKESSKMNCIVSSAFSAQTRWNKRCKIFFKKTKRGTLHCGMSVCTKEATSGLCRQHVDCITQSEPLVVPAPITLVANERMEKVPLSYAPRVNLLMKNPPVQQHGKCISGKQNYIVDESPRQRDA